MAGAPLSAVLSRGAATAKSSTKERRTSARGCPMLPRPPGQVQILLRESSFQGKVARGGTLAGQTSRRRHLFLCASPAERAGSTAASNPNPLLVFVLLPKRVTCFKLVTSGPVCNGNHYLNTKHISKHHFCSSHCRNPEIYFSGEKIVNKII